MRIQRPNKKVISPFQSLRYHALRQSPRTRILSQFVQDVRQQSHCSPQAGHEFGLEADARCSERDAESALGLPDFAEEIGFHEQDVDALQYVCVVFFEGLGEGGYGGEGLAVFAARDEVVDVAFVQQEGDFGVERGGRGVVWGLGLEGGEEVCAGCPVRSRTSECFRSGWECMVGSVPSNSSLEFDDTDAKYQILMVLKRLVHGRINGFESRNGIAVAPALAHDES